MAALSDAALLRGPVLVASIAFSLLLPIISQWSLTTFANLVLLGFGIGVTIHDVAQRLQGDVRSFMKRQLDRWVLDDILRSIFDPYEGLIAVITSTIIGNASMYSLPFSKEQRVKLVQSCLWTSDEQSKAILTEPGGICELFPEPLQEWLHPETKKVAEQLPVDKLHFRKKSPKVADDCTDVTECDTSQDESSSDGRNVVVEGDAIRKQRGPGLRHQNTTTPRFPTPIDVFTSVGNDWVSDMLKCTSESLPDTVVGGVSALGAFVCAAHLRYSPRARKVAMGAIEGAASLALSATVMAGITLLAAKHAKPTNTADIVKRIKQLLHSRRLKGTLAMLVLYCLARSRRRAAR